MSTVRGWLLGACLCLVLSDWCLGTELDVGVVQYLETLAKYRTIEFQSELYSRVAKGDGGRKRLSGLALLKRYEGFIDVAKGAFRFQETVYIDDKPTSIVRHRSWIDGLLQEFQDPNSSDFVNRQEAGGGTIVNREYRSSSLPSSPLMAMGFDVTSMYGDPIHLWDLIAKKHPIKLNDGSYLIENVFDWKSSFGTAYDLEFVLSETDGYLPKSIKYWDRTFGKGPESKVLFAEITVKRFGRVAGLSVPIDFEQKGPRQSLVRIVMDAAKIKLNQEYSREQYNLSFPADHWYVDQRTRVKYENGKEIQLEAVPPAPSFANHRPSMSMGMSWGPSGILLIVVAIMSFFVARKRGILMIFICAGLLNCTGCDPSNEVVSGKAIEISRDAVLLVVGGDQREVRIPVGGKSETSVLEVELVNKGSSPIVLSRDVRTTCGCMEAFVESSELQPGRKTVVIARIENARMPGRRNVGLTISVLQPKPTQFSLLVNTVFEGDWYVDRQEVVITGPVGSQALQTVSVFGPKPLLNQLRCDATRDLEVSEVSSSRIDCRIFQVKAEMQELHSDQNVGKLEFFSKVGQPNHATVHVRKFGKPAATWKPIAIRLSGSEPKYVELHLAEGTEFQSMESETCRVAWDVVSDRLIRAAITRNSEPSTLEAQHSDTTLVESTVTAKILVAGKEQLSQLPVLLAGGQND
jgi:hypothetical protein